MDDSCPRCGQGVSDADRQRAQAPQVDAKPQSVAQTMGATVKTDLLVLLSGWTSTLFTGILLSYVERDWGEAIYAWMFWFAIPVGAIGAGCLCTTGFYAAAKWLHRRPHLITVAAMALSSASALYLCHYLTYRAGTHVGTFATYLYERATSTSMTIYHGAHDVGSTGALGSTGVVLQVIQALGFAIGSSVVCTALIVSPYCKRCSQYLWLPVRQIRYIEHPAEFAALVGKLKALNAQREFVAMLDEHGAHGKASVSQAAEYQSALLVYACRGCTLRRIEFTGSESARSSWRKIEGFSQETHLPLPRVK